MTQVILSLAMIAYGLVCFWAGLNAERGRRESKVR